VTFKGSELFPLNHESSGGTLLLKHYIKSIKSLGLLERTEVEISVY